MDQFREHFDCWNRGELELMESMYSDDAVFDLSPVFADSAPVQGRDSMTRLWIELRETWQGIRLDPLEGYALDDGRFIGVMRLSGIGSQSGAEVEQRVAMLYSLRPEDNKILEARMFGDLEAALAAAQSSKPSVSPATAP